MKLYHLANGRPQRYLSKKNRDYKFNPPELRSGGVEGITDALVEVYAELSRDYVVDWGGLRR
jgi:hypothetical protein